MPESVISNGVIRNRSPVDLHPLIPVAVTSDAEVKATVARARVAQAEWENLGFEKRATLMKRAGKLMLQRRQEVLELLHDEAGKTPGEVLMGEALGPLQYIADWISVARPYLKQRKLPISPVAFPGKSGVVDLLPRGVVGIIAPWNFPLANFFKPVFAALLCGNAVVLKPSEHSPRMAAWFAKTLGEVLAADVLSCVQGDGQTGQALIRAGIDALTFTGSTQTGRAVSKLAAEQMIPVSLELGGKDAAIVLNDCDFDRTVAGIMHWSLTNAGQACGDIERVYVEAAIAEKFVQKLAAAVSKLRVDSGDPQTSDVGPLIQAQQLAIVEDHVANAVELGATVVCGGKRTGKGLWFQPTVLDHCDDSMKVVTEPTFGPVIPIVRVKNSDEAVILLNACNYGLNASVWSKDLKRAKEIARQLQVGTAFVNNHAFTGAMAFAPWTGTKQSGYGVASSGFALGHYTRPRTLVVDKSAKADAWWFPMDATLEELGQRLAEAQLGNVLAAWKVPLLIAKRQKTVLDFVRKGAAVVRDMKVAAVGETVAERAGASLRKNLFPTLAKLGKPPLTDRERAWGRAAMDTIFTGKPTDSIGALPKSVADDFIDEFYTDMPFPANLGIRAAFWVIGVAPVITRRKLETLEKLSPEDRLKTIEVFSKSDIYLLRQLAVLLKTSGGLGYASTTRFKASVNAAPAAKHRPTPKSNVPKARA